MKRGYQTPATAVAGTPDLTDRPVLWTGVIIRHGNIHSVSILEEQGAEVLVSGPTFLGWVRREEVARDE